MVVRSAYAELRYSPLRLAGTLVGMALTYLAPPLLAIFARRPRALVSALAAWIAMALAFQPMLRFYRPLAALGVRAAGDRRDLHGLHDRVGASSIGAGAAARGRAASRQRPLRPAEDRPAHDAITATEARSGKGHRDENFPVASHLIQPQHRGPILAFYRFVRAADDIADHPRLDAGRKARACSTRSTRR